MFQYKAEFLLDEAAPMWLVPFWLTPGFFFSCAINLFEMVKLLKLQPKKTATAEPNQPSFLNSSSNILCRTDTPPLEYTALAAAESRRRWRRPLNAAG